MRNGYCLFIFLLVVNTLQSQVEFTSKPLFDLNTGQDEIACMMFGNELVLMHAGSANLVNNPQGSDRPKFSLKSAQRGDDFSQWMKPKRFFRSLISDVGPASFDGEDSILYFSSSQNFGHAHGRQLKIYSSSWNGKRWGKPQLLRLGNGLADNCHPHYIAEHRMLVFTSNRLGGLGGMDLWCVFKTDDGWSEPFNPGLGVNSIANEIFPTYHNGDIYYATNRNDTWGGFDIRRALGHDQWKTSMAEAAPINSAADDVCLLFLSDDKAILTSNRAGGRGGDDLFLLQREVKAEEIHHMQALIECAGIPSVGLMVTIVNDAKEVVQTSTTDSVGRIDISSLRIHQSYRVMLAGNENESFAECLLVITDAWGNRLTEVQFNRSGMANLDLLPFQYSHISPLLLRDESLLTLNFEGQLFNEKLGDVGRGEPITILDTHGEPVAVAYTNDVGKFRFTRLDPQLKYVMRLSDDTRAEQVLITDKGEKITLPVLNAEINYQRVAPEDAITLVNEFNDSVQISAKDLFVINRIYFEYNSARLTPEASRQLNQLAIILERNAEIGLDLHAHTDARGESDYNLKLSQNRAKSAVDYLIQQGLGDARFTYSGYGEAHLLNECADGVACSEPEHAINRRMEIRFKRSSEAALLKD
jgi:outer membrane protein OmpA-like peptidoglycan-associated protein